MACVIKIDEVADLARHHSASVAQRLLEARRLLETTDLPVDQIAQHSGLGIAANLRLRLSPDAATIPTAYRRAYQGHLTGIANLSA